MPCLITERYPQILGIASSLRMGDILFSCHKFGPQITALGMPSTGVFSGQVRKHIITKLLQISNWAGACFCWPPVAPKIGNPQNSSPFPMENDKWYTCCMILRSPGWSRSLGKPPGPIVPQCSTPRFFFPIKLLSVYKCAICIYTGWWLTYPPWKILVNWDDYSQYMRR